ncbi:MAG: MFS transporter, partial [Deltaproteobacteria bacterium]
MPSIWHHARMMKIRLFPPISREVKFLLGSLIAHSVPTGIFLFVLPPYFAQVGRSSVEIGLLFTVSSLSSSFLFMPLGMIADRIGRKPVLIVGSLLPAFSSVIFLSTADLSLLMVAAFLGGIGLGGGMSAAAIGSTFDALLSEKASDGERTYVMSLAQASWTLSLGVGALLSGLPSRLQGMGVLDGVGAYRPLFYGAILLSLLSAALLHPIVERHGRAGGRRVHWLPRRSGRVVARLAVPFLLTGLGVGFIVQHLPLWFQLRYEVPMDRLAPWFSLSEFTGVVTILVVPWMARRLGV